MHFLYVFPRILNDAHTFGTLMEYDVLRPKSDGEIDTHIESEHEDVEGMTYFVTAIAFTMALAPAVREPKFVSAPKSDSVATSAS